MISILMASYNGEKYVSGQIDSLLNQTIQDFKLFICDDVSTDNTFAMVSEYAEKYPNKIFATQNNENLGGAKHNFMKMMIRHKDDYVMLCDQDDVWLPEKIEKTLAKMREMEMKYGTSAPLLVHADLKVVDRELRIISPSYKKMAHSSFKKNSLKHLVTMNIASGCTIMYNRALSDMVILEPEFFVIHDWWIALVATAFGKIEAVNEPVMLYRQHEINEIGAKKVLSFRYIRYVLTHLGVMSAKIKNSYTQAGNLLEMYGDTLDEKQRDLLTAYAATPVLTKIQKFRTIIKNRTFMHGIARKAAQIMILLTERRERI